MTGKAILCERRLLDNEMAMDLYEKGLCDRDIAIECGVKKDCVYRWRIKLGLKPNKTPPPVKVRSKLAQEAYEARKLGMNYGMYKAQQYESQRLRKPEHLQERMLD